MARETGADGSIYRGIRSNPMKEFTEAQLGNRNKSNRRLRQFLEMSRKVAIFDEYVLLEGFIVYIGHDFTQVLQFDAYWDDSARYGGRLRFFKLQYYLDSDLIDIKEVLEVNSGYDKLPKLLEKVIKLFWAYWCLTPKNRL